MSLPEQLQRPDFTRINHPINAANITAANITADTLADMFCVGTEYVELITRYNDGSVLWGIRYSDITNLCYGYTTAHFFFHLQSMCPLAELNAWDGGDDGENGVYYLYLTIPAST